MIFSQNLIRQPSAATFSLRLGHASALTVHWTVIHYLGAASLPKGEGNPFLRIACLRAAVGVINVCAGVTSVCHPERRRLRVK